MITFCVSLMLKPDRITMWVRLWKMLNPMVTLLYSFIKNKQKLCFVLSPEDIALCPLKSVKAILPAPKPQDTTSRTQVLLKFTVNFGDLNVK